MSDERDRRNAQGLHTEQALHPTNPTRRDVLTRRPPDPAAYGIADVGTARLRAELNKKVARNLSLLAAAVGLLAIGLDTFLQDGSVRSAAVRVAGLAIPMLILSMVVLGTAIEWVLDLCFPNARRVDAFDIAIQQYQARQQKDLRSFWKSLSGAAFQRELASAFQSAGIVAGLTRPNDTQSLAIEADGLRALVRCRPHGSRIGATIATESLAMLASQEVDAAILACPTGFTIGTRRGIRDKPLILMGLSELIDLCREPIEYRQRLLASMRNIRRAHTSRVFANSDGSTTGTVEAAPLGSSASHEPGATYAPAGRDIAVSYPDTYDLDNDDHIQLMLRIYWESSEALGESGYVGVKYAPAAILPHPIPELRHVFFTLQRYAAEGRRHPVIEHSLGLHLLTNDERDWYFTRSEQRLDDYLHVPVEDVPRTRLENEEFGAAVRDGQIEEQPDGPLYTTPTRDGNAWTLTLNPNRSGPLSQEGRWNRGIFTTTEARLVRENLDSSTSSKYGAMRPSDMIRYVVPDSYAEI